MWRRPPKPGGGGGAAPTGPPPTTTPKTDQLARRLAERGGRPIGVMNNGLGGNRILHDLRGDSGLRRFDRDVLAQPGVTHVIVMLGTNDLRNRWAKPEEEVTGEQMIAGLQQMAVRAHSAGVKIIGATLTPFGNETFMANAWNPTREKHRVTVNTWIRESGAFDGVADFDAAVRDPEIPTQMAARWDCGDGLHQSDAGYCHLADAIDLSLLD
jgi:lysophospholipase L1-like esterase